MKTIIVLLAIALLLPLPVLADGPLATVEILAPHGATPDDAQPVSANRFPIVAVVDALPDQEFYVFVRIV